MSSSGENRLGQMEREKLIVVINGLRILCTKLHFGRCAYEKINDTLAFVQFI